MARKTKRNKSDVNFRREAVRVAETRGDRPMEDVACRLGVSSSMLPPVRMGPTSTDFSGTRVWLGAEATSQYHTDGAASHPGARAAALARRRREPTLWSAAPPCSQSLPYGVPPLQQPPKHDTTAFAAWPAALL